MVYPVYIMALLLYIDIHDYNLFTRYSLYYVPGIHIYIYIYILYYTMGEVDVGRGEKKWTLTARGATRRGIFVVTLLAWAFFSRPGRESYVGVCPGFRFP